jgi:hypothetical protein
MRMTSWRYTPPNIVARDLFTSLHTSTSFSTHLPSMLLRLSRFKLTRLLTL